jgi:hypothetical protein
MNLKIVFLLLCIEMNSKLEKTLRKERQLKDVTVASYKSTFNTMARRYGVHYLSATWAKKNLDQIIEDLSGSSHSHKVSRCSAILLLFSPKQRRAPSSKFRTAYHRVNELLLKTNAVYVTQKQKQQKTAKETENWLAWTDIQKYLGKWQKVVLSDLKLKDGPQSTADFAELQRLLVLALYVHLPPRRLDYAGMKVIDDQLYKKVKVLEQERKANYLVVKNRTSKFFSFGSDCNKSRLKHGETCLTVKVPSALNRIINVWLDYNQTGVFLLNAKDEPLSKNGLGKIIRTIFVNRFNKRIGASLLRKIFLSFTFSGDTTYKLKMDIAKLMNHSPSTATIHYVKKG